MQIDHFPISKGLGVVTAVSRQSHSSIIHYGLTIPRAIISKHKTISMVHVLLTMVSVETKLQVTH